jgi:hypothetical protein
MVSLKTGGFPSVILGCLPLTGIVFLLQLRLANLGCSFVPE